MSRVRSTIHGRRVAMDAAQRAKPDSAALTLVTFAIAAALLVAWRPPGTWLWGLNLHRFMPPLEAWIAIACLVFALFPPFARPIARRLSNLGDAALQHPLLAGSVWGLVLALTVVALRDRTMFMGDFLVRAGAAQHAEVSEQLVPQALPFDLWLHTHLPRLVGSARLMDSGQFEIALGALKAFGFGLCAFHLARRSGTRRAGVVVATVAASGGAALAMFTGYPKALSELTLLTAIFLTASVAEIRNRSGFWLAGLAFVAALLTHRSAVVLLPGFVVLSVDRLRRDRGLRARTLDLAMMSGVVAAVAWLAPHVVRSWSGVDVRHFAPGRTSAVSVLLDAVAPLHLLDVANAALLYAPLAPLLALSPGADEESYGLAPFWLAVLAPAIALMIFIHPQQGAFRDHDVYCTAGVALSFFTASRVGRLLSGSKNAWTVVPLIVVTIVCTISLLTTYHVTTRGIRRAQSFLSGPPLRSSRERAHTWRFLGSVAHQVGSHEQALRAYQAAAELAPTPSTLALLATEAGEVQDARLARSAWLSVAERQPSVMAWLEVARASIRLGDWSEARRAALGALAIDSRNPEALRIVAEAGRSAGQSGGASDH